MTAPTEQGALQTLEELRFDNLVLRALPVEDGPRTTPRPVSGACFSRAQPAPLDNPVLVAASPDALRLLGLDADVAARPDKYAAVFGGNEQLLGMEPAAHCYAGHQFGSFAGQLGDGAAMYLGEVVGAQGRQELQLKGAGMTPYSRAADGRKVLRSSLREFLASEAMHALGIPTTRAGTLVTSASRVERDPFYDGNPVLERCSVVSRIAPSFLRFGSFEIFKPTDAVTGRSGPSVPHVGEMLPRMVDYVIRVHHPDIWQTFGGPQGVEGGADITPAQRLEMVAEWFNEVCRRTGALVAQWQCAGFCHGVLNTDNMSILGLTIDYGPFGWLDRYDPDHVCNGSDDSGRYAYSAQPGICRWNCEMLAQALGIQLLPRKDAQASLVAFDRAFSSTYRATMRRKLGLQKADEGAADDALVAELLKTMEETGADWTNTFRRLALVPLLQLNSGEPDPPAERASSSRVEHLADGGFLKAVLPELASAVDMAQGSTSRIPPENLQMLTYLAANDKRILYNLGVDDDFVKRETARAAAATKWHAMTESDKRNSDEAAWTGWLEKYIARLGREEAAGAKEEQRQALMSRSNPRIVLRNWVAEEAIQAAEKGDFGPTRKLLELLRDPFSEPAAKDSTISLAGASGSSAAPVAGVCPLRIGGKPPEWAVKLCVTCSS